MIDRACIDDRPAPARHLMEGGFFSRGAAAIFATETFRLRPRGSRKYIRTYVRASL